MFPTLNYLFEYLFGISLPLPVQTFGFFVALAFWAAYQVFTAEFKRYEAAGKIHAFKKQVMVGRSASAADMAVNFLLGFVLGYKIGGILWLYHHFLLNPRGYVLSLQGSWLTGFIAGAVFAWWVYRDQQQKKLARPGIIEKTVHPYQLMGRIVLAVGVWGVIGSKLFDVFEHWQQFVYNPVGTVFNSTGFTYYGGLIFGALSYLYIGHKHGMKLVHLADIGSPGMMLAYSVGRIGCVLSGDGDWGIVNLNARPAGLYWLPDWAWSYRFPHNVINAGITMPGCNGTYCNQLVQGVYPTSLYEVILCLGFFGLMWLFRRQIIIPGLMFFVYLILNGGERLLIENIRVNYKYHLWGLYLTQAQCIGSLMVAGGLLGISWLLFTGKRFLNKASIL